jgi:hypothetical protein
MLAISSDKFKTPYKQGNEEGWMVESVDDTESRFIKTAFTYTIIGFNPMNGERYHYGFIYEGNSVKPNPRTLRKLGAASTSEIVRQLSMANCRTGDQSDFVRRTINSTIVG